MKLTRIEDSNREYFAHLCPDELLDNEDYIGLGVIDEEEVPACVCVSSVYDNMLAIRWLFTDPAMRDQGYAGHIMDVLNLISGKIGLSGMLVNYSSAAENMDEFLTDAGFLVGEDHELYRVPISDLVYGRAMDSVSDETDTPENTFTLTEITGQKAIRSLLEAHDIDMDVLKGVSPRLSVVYTGHEDGAPGAIFVSEAGDDLVVKYMINSGSLRGLSNMLRVFRDTLIIEGKVNGNLIFSDRTGKTVALVENLTENDREEYIIPGRMQAVRLFV